MADNGKIAQGMVINYKNQPWAVARTTFVNPGNWRAFTKANLRNLKTGQMLEVTFRANDPVDQIDMAKQRCQFLYKDSEGYHFMNNDSYEQFFLTEEIIGGAKDYLLDGTDVYAMYLEGIPVSIELPPKMDFKVIETTPGVKGDTASGGDKECTIETGIKVKVPLFIKEGDLIKVNTETGAYVGKA